MNFLAVKGKNKPQNVNANSCGHTTDFHLGKTDLPRANSSKICLGKFISGFFYLGKNSGKVTLLISAPKVFTPVEFFGA